MVTVPIWLQLLLLLLLLLLLRRSNNNKKFLPGTETGEKTSLTGEGRKTSISGSLACRIL
jgi:hypothetical protein